MDRLSPENAEVDFLSAAVSDGWMAVSTGEHGLLVGFNALAAAILVEPHRR